MIKFIITIYLFDYELNHESQFLILSLIISLIWSEPTVTCETKKLTMMTFWRFWKIPRMKRWLRIDQVRNIKRWLQLQLLLIPLLTRSSIAFFLSSTIYQYYFIISKLIATTSTEHIWKNTAFEKTQDFSRFNPF